jgi:hypothetical protein
LFLSLKSISINISETGNKFKRSCGKKQIIYRQNLPASSRPARIFSAKACQHQAYLLQAGKLEP